MTSLPEDLKPCSSSPPRSSSSSSPWNGVPSTREPRSEPTLPPSISSTWPTVIRDGRACGVHHEVGNDPLLGEWHVFLGREVAHDALLSVSGRELVPKLGDALVAHLHLRELGAVLALHQRHGVDDARFARTHRHARLAPLLRGESAHVVGLLKEAWRAGLAEQHRGLVHLRLRVDEAVLVEVGVRVPPRAPRTS